MAKTMTLLVVEVPHCLFLKFVNGTEVSTIQWVCGIHCQRIACREVSGVHLTVAFSTQNCHLTILMKPFRPRGTMTSAGGGTHPAGSSSSAYPACQIPIGPASES